MSVSELNYRHAEFLKFTDNINLNASPRADSSIGKRGATHSGVNASDQWAIPLLAVLIASVVDNV